MSQGMDKGKLLDNLRRQCSRREYCSSDIRRKIADACRKSPESFRDSSPEALAEEILASLRKDNYLSDARYASAFARDKASLSGWGALKIRHALASKGISAADMDAALDSVEDEGAKRRLEKLLRTKAVALAGDPQRRLKLLRFALGRGYSYDEVEDLVDALTRP